MKLVEFKEGELKLTLLSAAYFFFLLTSYFMLRPLRDVVAADNADSLKWLFAGTLAGMLLANPVYGWLVSRWPRQRFIPWVYRFFALNLLAFFLLVKLRPEAEQKTVWMAFFIWLSVFNMFVVSVFWSFMADVFRLEQSKRLFGVIALGGTAGAILGSLLTKQLVVPFGAANVLLLAVGLLEVSTQCMSWVARLRGPIVAAAASGTELEKSESGDVWNGLRITLQSPYLRVIALYALLLSTIGTVFYVEQSSLVGAAFTDRDAKRAFLANIDLWTNIATLVAQLFLTASVVRRFGIGFALVLQPIVCVAGLATLGLWNALTVIIVCQATLRTLQNSVTRPAREMLFTVVGREVKYKSKGFIDTFVIRLGDQVGVWSTDWLKTLKFTPGAIAWAAVPIGAVWCAVAALLSVKQKKLARED